MCAFGALFFGFSFQEGISSNIISLVCFHDLVIELLVLIVFAVVSVLWYTFSFRLFAVRLDMHLIEFIWTLVPTIALIFIGLPSVWSLYFIEEEFSEGSLTEVGVVGNQWFWEFYFSERNYLEELVDGSLSSYYLEGGDEDFRTLEVNSMVSIPQGVTCFNVTSNDVIHSFSCPALGVNIDAVPGNCNSFFSSILQPGIFFGSCAEMCGVNHSFMPFCILVYSFNALEFCELSVSDLDVSLFFSSIVVDEEFFDSLYYSQSDDEAFSNATNFQAISAWNEYLVNSEKSLSSEFEKLGSELDNCRLYIKESEEELDNLFEYFEPLLEADETSSEVSSSPVGL